MAVRSSRTSSRRSKSKGLSIPSLADVESRIDVPDGEYLVKVEEVTQEDGDKAPYLKWVFVIAEGKSEGGKLYNNTSLSEKALWNLKTLLEALGVEIPDDEFDIDPEDLVDLELMVSVELETYEGKKRPKIVDFWPVEEEPKPARGKAKRAAKEEADDDKPVRGKKPARGKAKEPEVTQEDINGMDQEELEAFVDENKLEVDLGKLKTLRKMRAAVIDAAEEEKLLAE